MIISPEGKVLITRPEPDAVETAKTFEDHGFRTIVHPLLEVCQMPVKLNGPYGAYMATSSNAVRAAERLEVDKDMPIFTVGEHTARVATKKGWKNVHMGGGVSDTLVPLVMKNYTQKNLPICYLSAEVVAGNVNAVLTEAGYIVDQHSVYSTIVASKLTKEVVDLYMDGSIEAVTLFSMRTANVWNQLVREYKLDERQPKPLRYCLSSQIASCLGPKEDKTIRFPKFPSIIDMLDLMKKENPGLPEIQYS